MDADVLNSMASMVFFARCATTGSTVIGGRDTMHMNDVLQLDSNLNSNV